MASDPTTSTKLDETTLIPLSPMDAAMGTFGLTILYVFPPPSSNSKPFDLEKLHGSFQRLVEEEYRILLGELHIDPVTGVVSVKQSREATAKGGSLTIPFEKVFECEDSTEDAMQSLSMEFMSRREPTQVVTIKATALRDGGLALGVNISHTLLDGEGMFTFMKVWGEFYRDISKDERTVICHDRGLLSGRGTGALLPHPEFKVKQAPAPASSEPAALPTTTQRVFHVSPERMKKIKAIASSGLVGGDEGNYVSTVDALTALLIILITQARGHGQGVRFTTGVNARKRFSPPLPENFAGNVVFNAFSSYEAHELSAVSEEAIQTIARRVRESILRRDEEYLRDAIEFITSHANLMDVVVGTNFFFGPDLMFTSWANFGMYDAEFETNPWYVGPPKLPLCDGMMVFLEGIRGAEGLDLLVLLESNAMERLVQLWDEVPLWN